MGDILYTAKLRKAIYLLSGFLPMSHKIHLFLSVIIGFSLVTLFWGATQMVEAANLVTDQTSIFNPIENPASFEIRGLAACLSYFTVVSNSDSGPGTLRQALADVCSGGTIDFAPTLTDQTITLASTELSITKTITITNPNALNLRISGNDAHRVFSIQAGAAVTITNLIITHGRAIGDRGGSIYNIGTLNLNNCTINYSSASNGGAGISNDGVLTIDRCTFNTNITSSGGGGVRNEGTLTINNSAFYNNTAIGGGILNEWNGTMTVNTSTFHRNIASQGGGIVNYGMSTVNNSTFSSNFARYYGGGILNGFGATLIVNNSTFSDNSTDTGGTGSGIYNFSFATLHLRNSILANSSNGGDCYNRGTIATNLNNLIEDGSCSPFLSTEPNLGPLQGNGGDTLTHALLPGSPAINAGDSGTCLAVDQRGITRPQLGQCDIGAFESLGFTLVISNGNNQETTIGSVFSTPFEVTITSSDGSEPVDSGFITFTAPDSGPSTTFAPTATVTISEGVASLNITANIIAGGPYNVVASTEGGNSVNFSLTNTRATPAVSVTSSMNPSDFGQAVTFTAIVSSNVGIPTGSIAFVIDGISQSPVSMVDGQAILSTSTLSVGNHSVSANYSGDTNFEASSGSLVGGQTVVGTPELAITKTVHLNNNPVQPGESLTYTIVVANNGNSDATGVIISDTLPTYINGSGLNQTVNITAGDNVTFTLSVTLSNSVPFGEIITNTASFSHTSGSGQDSNVFTVAGPPHLFITKTVQLGNDPIQPGDPLTYTIVVINNGAGNAIGVVVSDILPSYIDGPDLYQTVDITAGTSLTFTLNVSLSNNTPFGEVITNTAFFSYTLGSGQDSNAFSVKEENKAYLPIILKN
jgi:uncharacterized repeat protein (TIGR01451 family)